MDLRFGFIAFITHVSGAADCLPKERTVKMRKVRKHQQQRKESSDFNKKVLLQNHGEKKSLFNERK